MRKSCSRRCQLLNKQAPYNFFNARIFSSTLLRLVCLHILLSHIYLNHFHIFCTIILLFHFYTTFFFYVQFPQRNHDILPVIRIWIQFFFSTELAYCHFDGCNDDIPVKWPVSLDLQSIYPRLSNLYLWGKVTLTSSFTLCLTHFVF